MSSWRRRAAVRRGTITPGTTGTPYGTLSVGGTINFQVGSIFSVNMSAGQFG